MGAYRIGRVNEPWLNFTPPIRGGIYRKYEDEDSVTSEDEDHNSISPLDSGSFNSSSMSLDIIAQETNPNSFIHTKSSLNNKANVINGQSGGFDGSDVHQITDDGTCKQRLATKPPSLSSTPINSAHVYTSIAIQKEIDDDIRDYPSVDAETQRNITRKYQALHQRVKNEGFYDCRYIEYGKEIIRFALLFTIFLVSLRYAWYMTSAAFLGLFWVSRLLSRSIVLHILTIVVSNNVYRP